MAGFLEILRSGDWLTRERMRLVGARGARSPRPAGLLYPGRHLGRARSTTRAARSEPTSPTSMPPAPTCSTATRAAPFDLARQHAREQADLRRRDAVLRLALSAVLPVRRRAAGADALRRCARGLAGRDAGALSSGDPRDRRLFIPGRRGASAGVHSHRAPGSAPAATTLAGLRRGPLWLLLALAFPAVFINLGHGHNGFLTAALIGGALVHARSPADPRRHPVRPARLQAAIRPDDPAGAGRERALAQLSPPPRRRSRCSRSQPRSPSARDIWRAFFAFDRTSPARSCSRQGDTGWHKIQSVFSWARMWGAPSRSPTRCKAQ